MNIRAECYNVNRYPIQINKRAFRHWKRFFTIICERSDTAGLIDKRTKARHICVTHVRHPRRKYAVRAIFIWIC